MIIDGESAVLGRLSSYVAKQLLKGESVTIINAEKVIITGSRKLIEDRYIKRRDIGGPHHGPFFPKKPDLIVRRSIRGMLPYKKGRGAAALRKLRVQIGSPSALAEEPKKLTRDVKTRFITVGALAKRLGWMNK